MTLRDRIVELRRVDTAELQDHAGNWRTHPQAQRDALSGLLSEVGIADALLAYHSPRNDGALTLIDGHLRKADHPGAWPVLVLDLDDAEADLLLATLDPLAAMADAAQKRLAALLDRLSPQTEGVQTALDDLARRAGLALHDLEASLSATPEAQLDRAEALQAHWQVQPGQLWVIPSRRLPDCGHHLLCGDSTRPDDVARLMAGHRAALGFTSPPYWVGKEYERQQSVEEIEAFIAALCRSFTLAVRPDASRIVVNTGTGFTTSFDKRRKRQVLLLIDKWANAFFALGWNLRHVRHWLKEGQLQATALRADLIDQHCEFLAAFEADEGEEMDFCDALPEDEVALLQTFYPVKGANRGQAYTDRRWALRSYWDDVRGAARQSGHCASFPVELVGRHLLLYTRRGESVVDLCLGAGTTLVSAEQLGRQGYGLEIEAKYCAVTLQRLADLGLAPQRPACR
jgi:DNA modification methylase